MTGGARPSTIPGGAPAVAAHGLHKRFGRVAALTDVSVEFRFGEIHGLVGQNGAGKTTLASVLFGLHRADAGHVTIRDERTELRSPRDALAAGIGMVQQRFVLSRQLTVAENIMLGNQDGRGLRVDRDAWARRVDELAASCGLEIDPGALVADLPYSVQQRVAILRALERGSEFLILDEPTSNLTPQQVSELTRLLFSLRDAGKGILLITHKINEVLEATSRITVMRDGRVTAGLATTGATRESVAEAMVGSAATRPPRRARPRFDGGAALELEAVVLPSDVPEPPAIDLQVRPGEIVGVAGVAGNGQTELAEVVSGMLAPARGLVYIGGRDMTAESAAERARAGLGYVPEDKDRVATAPTLTVAEALALKSLRSPESSRRGLLRLGAIRQSAEQRIREFDIRPPDADARCGQLSGGNLQKLVLARELGAAGTVLVAAQPTQGLDIAAIDFVHEQIVRRAEQGAGVLLFSTELDEIISLSDRVAVMYRFGIIGVLQGADVTPEKIGHLMAGVTAPLAERRSA